MTSGSTKNPGPFPPGHSDASVTVSVVRLLPHGVVAESFFLFLFLGLIRCALGERLHARGRLTSNLDVSIYNVLKRPTPRYPRLLPSLRTVFESLVLGQ